MEKVIKLDTVQPRFLRYRSHYKIYVLCFMIISMLVMTFWTLRFLEDGYQNVVQYQSSELIFSAMYFAVAGTFYFLWLRSRLKRSVQVFDNHILVHNGKQKEVLNYADIQSVTVVCWSIFYVKMQNGFKHYFNSSLERVDYIWEGIHAARPELIPHNEFEEYRIKLVQYDHHQKRKEWFFKHKLVDVFNWAVLPVVFLLCAYVIQSRNVFINQSGLYFFRLFMYALLVLLSTAFFYSLVVKKFIFDRKLNEQMGSAPDKIRDLEFEGVVLQRSKIFQFITACFVLAMVIRLDINLFSVTKVKEDLAGFNLKKGHTIVVDNRFNCIACRYELKDGDLVMFGRGIIGQVLAKEGDMVGQLGHDTKGRMIASENVQEVPRGHLAVKASNGKDIVFIKIDDLIGKIQN